MEEEEEIETELSTKKEHPLPLQTEILTNTPKVTPHSMNSQERVELVENWNSLS